MPSLPPAPFFRALSDDTRLRCLALLHAEGELCVCELTHALNEAQPKISRHLAYLREAGLVDDRRAGLWIYYRLRALPPWAQHTLDALFHDLRATDPYRADREALGEMPNRPGARGCA